MVEAFPSNLPIQLTSFIGREPEIVEVKRLLGTTRLLMLTGSGGCGKTRLALRVADGLHDEFPDGVWLIDLAPLSDPSFVPQTVASVFDLHESADTPITQILKNYLRAKNLLLVLDNCEHLIQACAQLCNEVLHASPSLKILATSREAMNIAGETAFRVPSLSLPDSQQMPPVKSFSQYESLRLFIERAQAARPEFEVKDANAFAIAQICQRLDGMPLAIELAAARVNALPVEEIASHLDHRFQLLTNGSRTALPRYQTLRASIDWSYNLLSNAERVLLRRLAVFAGGFTVDAVEGICIEEDKNEILDLLSRLVQKSLVVVKLDDKPRYRLLETIRQYAREKLAESGEEDVTRDCHLRYFMNFAQAIAPKLHGPEQMQTLDRLDSELDNLRAALEWSAGEGRVEKGLRLAAALMWFWERRGYFSEGRARVESLLNQPEVAAKTLVRANGLVAASLMASSQSAVWVGGSKASRPYLEEAVAIAREHGQVGKRLCALALTFLSNSVYRDDHERGQAQYDEAWAIVQELNDPWISALLLHQRAHWYHQIQDDYEAAGRAFEDSMNLFRSLGDKRWVTILLNDIAIFIYPRQGNYAGARLLLEQNLSYFREIRDRMHICFALGHLGHIARVEGNYALAKKYYWEELGIGRELGSNLLIVDPTMNLGFCAIHDGELDSARPYLVESIVLAQALDSKPRVANALAGLARVAVAEKRARRAVQIFGAVDALRQGSTIGNLTNEAENNQSFAIARKQLDKAAFDATWNEGRAMKMEQAIEFAMAEPDHPQPAKAVPEATREKFGGLTPREREVAVLISQGKSNPEIAKALVVSERTVTTHVSNILSKLEFTSRTQIASWATAKRLTNAETKT